MSEGQFLTKLNELFGVHDSKASSNKMQSSSRPTLVITIKQPGAKKKLSSIKEQPIENWATVQKQWAMIHWENWGDDSHKHQREMGIRGYNLTHLHLLAWSQRERKLNFIFS